MRKNGIVVLINQKRAVQSHKNCTPFSDFPLPYVIKFKLANYNLCLPFKKMKKKEKYTFFFQKTTTSKYIKPKMTDKKLTNMCANRVHTNTQIHQHYFFVYFLHSFFGCNWNWHCKQKRAACLQRLLLLTSSSRRYKEIKNFFFFWTAVQILFSFSFTQTSHFFLTHIRSNENNLPAPVFESTTTEPVREGVCKCKCKRHKSHQLCLVGVVSVVPPLPAREGRLLPLPLRGPGIANRRREKQTDSVSGGQCSPSLVFLTTTLLLLHLAIDKFNCAENSTCTPNTYTHTEHTAVHSLNQRDWLSGGSGGW